MFPFIMTSSFGLFLGFTFPINGLRFLTWSSIILCKASNRLVGSLLAAITGLLLDSKQPLTVCHCDTIDYFKPVYCRLIWTGLLLEGVSFTTCRNKTGLLLIAKQPVLFVILNRLQIAAIKPFNASHNSTVCRFEPVDHMTMVLARVLGQKSSS